MFCAIYYFLTEVFVAYYCLPLVACFPFTTFAPILYDISRLVLKQLHDICIATAFHYSAFNVQIRHFPTNTWPIVLSIHSVHKRDTYIPVITELKLITIFMIRSVIKNYLNQGQDFSHMDLELPPAATLTVYYPILNCRSTITHWARGVRGHQPIILESGRILKALLMKGIFCCNSHESVYFTQSMLF